MANQIRVRYAPSPTDCYTSEMRGLRSLIIFTLVTTAELLSFGLKILTVNVMWKTGSVRSWKNLRWLGIDWDESPENA